VETENALQDSCAMLNKALVLPQYVLLVLNGIYRIRAVVAVAAVAVVVVVAVAVVVVVAVVVAVVDKLFHVIVVVCALKQPMTFIGVAIQKVYHLTAVALLPHIQRTNVFQSTEIIITSDAKVVTRLHRL
jgi:hypothetical protein